MKKKIELSNLVIEVTRKCNMKCPHCLRGERQNIDIYNDYITKLLSDVESISTLTFSGGEPTLNIPAIRFTLDELKRLNIYVDCFYIVTNGNEKAISQEFLLLLMDLYQYQGDKDNIYGNMIEMSKDKYHSFTKEQQKTIDILSMFTFFGIRDLSPRIINEGKGADVKGMDKVNLFYSSDLCVYENEIDIQVEDTIYLNVNGQICNNCDYSYNSQNMFECFNLNNKTFYEGIISYIEEE